MPDVQTDPIKHVVLLVLENHSFDQMLGAMKAVYPELDGVDLAHPRVNLDDKGKPFHQKETHERQMLLDPHHEVPHVAVQMQGGNSGFVLDFARNYTNASDAAKHFIMGYYPLDFLPALHGLAREYTICDKWFSSLPGPTWPNRFFAFSGTSSGHVDMPEDGNHKIDPAGYFEQDQATLFDQLSEKGINWKIYFQGIPQTVVFRHQRRVENLARYYYMQQFYDDARGDADDFPQFSLIEPDFMGYEENDDHPPHDIMKAQKLIADVYNALRNNEELWKSTLLVIYYDEHGGFYDHVTPPQTIPPDDHILKDGYTFNQLGIRVPALLVSPWVEKRVENTQFDHTSVLKYLIEKWQLAPLGNRTAAATSIGVALRSTARTGVLPHIAMSANQLNPPDAEREEKAEEFVVGHHKSLALIANYIKFAAIEDGPVFLTRLARLWMDFVQWFKEIAGEMPFPQTGLRTTGLRPDRLSREKSPLRDNFAKYLGRQKMKAIPEIAKTIRDQSATPAAQEIAIRTLGHLTGRRFHREQSRRAMADQWLKERGH